MKCKKKYVILVIAIILMGSALCGILVWTNTTYKPTNLLFDYVKESDYIQVGDFYVFKPHDNEQLKNTGIVLYPGALVEPLAYGYYGKALAEHGYLVAIPRVRLNLSITDNDKASEVIALYPEISNWYIGGHSMGGVSAAFYAQKHPSIKGIILLASYPSKSTDLSHTSLEVLSLYGEKDGLTSLEDIEASKKNLPCTATFVPLKGGNHAQFGIYGAQKGDLPAGIDVITQQQQMIDATLMFLGQ